MGGAFAGLASCARAGRAPQLLPCFQGWFFHHIQRASRAALGSRGRAAAPPRRTSDAIARLWPPRPRRQPCSSAAVRPARAPGAGARPLRPGRHGRSPVHYAPDPGSRAAARCPGPVLLCGYPGRALRAAARRSPARELAHRPTPGAVPFRRCARQLSTAATRPGPGGRADGSPTEQGFPRSGARGGVLARLGAGAGGRRRASPRCAEGWRPTGAGALLAAVFSGAAGRGCRGRGPRGAGAAGRGAGACGADGRALVRGRAASAQGRGAAGAPRRGRARAEAASGAAMRSPAAEAQVVGAARRHDLARLWARSGRAPARRATSWLPSTAGSPRASTRRTSGLPRRCSTRSLVADVMHAWDGTCRGNPHWCAAAVVNYSDPQSDECSD